jgi:tetratricopeptide (TPR) repeat protein
VFFRHPRPVHAGQFQRIDLRVRTAIVAAAIGCSWHPASPALAQARAPANGLPQIPYHAADANTPKREEVVAPQQVQAPSPPLPASVVPLPSEPPAATRAGGSRGSAVLLDQAHYWIAQSRPDLAQQSLERLLQIEPENPEALAIAAELAVLNGNPAAAQGYLARLNQIAPGSQATGRVAEVLRATNVNQTALAEARRLAQAGQQQAAIQRYRESFSASGVPAAYAIEYYQTLSGASPEGFREARAAMAALVAREPNNLPLQLAYAQILTYRETTREEGIERLRRLTQFSDIASGARASWRQALLWQGRGEQSIARIKEYQSVFPDDPEIAQKLVEVQPTLEDRLGAIRIRAFDLLPRDPREAGELFAQALAANPEDVDATLGLGMVRRAQRREAEARKLFDRAVELAPGRKDEFQRAMGYVNRDSVPYSQAGQGGRGQPGPVVLGPLAQAWRALNRGDLNEAQKLTQAAPQRNSAERAEAARLLGYVALRQRDFGLAEQRFREALSQQPNQREVQAALYGALLEQGRFQDADQFASQTGFRPNVNSRLLQSNALRAQAQRAPDNASRIALLRSAVAAEPGNVWAAHDLARLLKGVGQFEEAKRLERDLAQRGTPDALYAAALLAEYDGRVADTVSRLNSIPASRRTPEANLALERGRRLLEVRRLELAARGMPRSAAAQQLVAMAGQPDPNGELRSAIILAFNRLRQPENLAAAVRAGNPGASSTTPEAKAAIAAALMDAGQLQAAENLATRAERDPRLVAAVRQTASVSRARSAGSQGGADTAIEPAPENWRAQLSLARVYARSGRGDEAASIAEGVLRRHPENVEARSVAGEIAVVQGNLSRAEQILAEGQTRRADELQMALLEARIARARDDQVRARRALEMAARLRSEQLREASR